MKTVLNYQEVDQRPLHFGFVLGLNTCDFDIRLSQDSIFADVSRLNPGFHVGIVSNLRLNDYMDLRFLPGMSFGSWDVHYTQISNNEEIDHSPQRLPYYPIEFPLVLKLKSDRINNYRPYLITDFTIRYDMGGSKKFLPIGDKERPRLMRLKPLNFYYSIGFGIDYYFEFFKLSTEIKMAFGQRDILNHEPYSSYEIFTTSIEKLKSNMVFLSFHFE